MGLGCNGTTKKHNAKLPTEETSKSKPRSKNTKSRRLIDMVCSVDIKGTTHQKFFPIKQTVNQTFYLHLSERLRSNIFQDNQIFAKEEKRDCALCQCEICLQMCVHRDERQCRNSSPKRVLYFEGSFFFLVSLGGVRLSPLGTSATVGLLYQPRMIDDGDYGAVGGMRIGRGNRSTRRKPAPVSLCPPQIPPGPPPPRREASD
jgi:hypothetical protein